MTMMTKMNHIIPITARLTKKTFEKLLKLIVQLPAVNLGARFPDREIPCYCPFHKKIEVLLKKQNCYQVFDEFKCKCERADNNRGIYKTKNNLRNHCLSCDDFYH